MSWPVSGISPEMYDRCNPGVNPVLSRTIPALANCTLRPEVTVSDGVIEAVGTGGPLIIASRHVSEADPLVLSGAIHSVEGMRGVNKKLHWVAKAGLFENPALAWLLNQAGVIPAVRAKDVKEIGKERLPSNPGEQMIAKALAALQNGQHLGFFPSGRFDNERPPTIMPGVCELILKALKYNAPRTAVIPTAIIYSNDLTSKFGSPRVHFGQPVTRDDILPSEMSVRGMMGILSRRIDESIDHIAPTQTN